MQSKHLLDKAQEFLMDRILSATPVFVFLGWQFVYELRLGCIRCRRWCQGPPQLLVQLLLPFGIRVLESVEVIHRPGEIAPPISKGGVAEVRFELRSNHGTSHSPVLVGSLQIRPPDERL